MAKKSRVKLANVEALVAIRPHEIVVQNGKSFLYQGRGAALCVPDCNEAPRQSRLVVLEDGVALGPPHVAHVEIDEQGSGRFSHWGNPDSGYVVFSSSDNTDPRENGRIYQVAILIW